MYGTNDITLGIFLWSLIIGSNDFCFCHVLWFLGDQAWIMLVTNRYKCKLLSCFIVIVTVFYINILSYLRKSHFTFSFTATNWILGGMGETCKTVCGKSNRVCNPDEQSKITNEHLVKSAMLKAGQSCEKFLVVEGPPEVPKTPSFWRGRDICFYLPKGARSACDGDAYVVSFLCYCDGGKVISCICLFKEFKIKCFYILTVEFDSCIYFFLSST